MVKIILHGCSGQMGKVMQELAAEDDGIEIVAGIDVVDSRTTTFPVYKSLAACSLAADVVVDFSVAAAIDSLLDGLEQKKLPVVVCTTGLSEAQLERLERISHESAVLRSANMSLGINILLKLVKEAAKVLSPAGFDIEIEEKHHRRKLDAPSGTALALADSINEAMDGAFHYTYDRSQRSQKRDPKEIGISAVRGGSIVGEHDVIFAGTDELVELRHTAFSRSIFGKGALEAAKFLADKPAGYYTMQDVIEG